MKWYSFILVAVMLFFSACSDNSSSSKNLSDEEKIFACIKENDIVGIKKLLSKKPSLINARNTHNETPLHYAITNGNIKLIKLFVQSGASINAQDNFLYTPLHEAAFYCDADILKLLIDNGAAVNKINKYGKTPLEVANDSYQKMRARATIPPSTIKNYKAPTAEEIKEEEKRYLDRIKLLKEHGAKTAEELKSSEKENR